jgi:hypothetical protein
VLAELARSVGASVRTGQPPLGPVLLTVTDPHTSQTSQEVSRTAKRGDLLIVLGSKQLLVDVTIPRATAPSTMANPALQRPGACVAAAEKTKQNGYAVLCKQRGMTLVPFAVESYGGVGPAARKLLTQLAGQSGEHTASSFLTDALTRISVELQRGNALILQRGMQQLRVDQHEMARATAGSDSRADLSIGAQSPQPSSHRRQQRLFKEWRGQQLELGDIFHANLRAGGGAAGARQYRFAHVAAAEGDSDSGAFIAA